MLTIGVDVGGTKVAAGLVDEAGTLLRRTRRPTPSASPDDVEDVIAACVTELCAGVEVEAVGIGAAGFVTADRSTVLLSPNLSWRDEPLRDGVAERVGLPVVVENDANAAAWGEYRFGAGRGEQFLVVVTVGTGIGGGVVIDGALHRGRHGLGAEFGHMQVVRGGRRCGCGQDGCWEQYCSGRALLHEAREIAGVQREYGRRLLELGGGRPEGIEAIEVTQAAREGDPAALACFAEVGGWLGQGLADLAAVLDPGAFVIGGGVSDAGDLLLEPTRRAFVERLTGTGERPVADVRRAELGNDAGLVGAADLARDRPTG
ncbi:MAG: Glucokinase [uncultured Frankineae bacterium]|uniref:Glucokinase n=1 Tax=uncultured Frankineae bacterium TaxID=437475 RepID=A0A6J4LA20_9ACTN|nr:MAG: Glucokinase [uncultured Frankineae bacterium]